MPDPKPIDAQILALPESAGSALYGMLDVLATAGRAWREIAGLDGGPERMRPRLVAETSAPFKCGYGVPVEPDLAIGPENVPDILVLPDFWLSTEDSLAGRYDELKDWLRMCRAKGTHIYSACSGSVLLASAGILDGLPATSHWAYAELFKRAFPTVAFDPTPNLCFSDKAGRLVTSGGASNWNDLALHIIARHISPGEAVATGKYFLMKWHAEGQLPYANQVIQRPHADSAVRRAETWLAENFSTADPVSGAVAAIGLPERSLKRRFQNATGSTLIAYAQNLRVEAAKAALEQSDKPVEDVSVEVGYENVAFFRRLFKRATGLTPSDYRKLYKPMRVLQHS